MESRGLGEIKVKGWNGKVVRAQKWKVVKMVYNNIHCSTIAHLKCSPAVICRLILVYVKDGADDHEKVWRS